MKQFNFIPNFFAILALAGGSAQAAIVINTASNPTGTPNTSTDELAYASFVSTTDLLHGIVGTGGSWNTIVPSASPSGLNDGTHGGDGGILTGAAFANDGTSSTRTFDLGGGPGGLGFNITEIQSIAAWFGAGYANQRYQVFVSLVGNAAFTLLTTVDFQPFGVNGGAATKVNVVDSTPGAFIATGVDAIQFNILDTISSNSGGVVMREIDVFGSAVVPEPTSALLIGMAGLTILRRRRA